MLGRNLFIAPLPRLRLISGREETATLFAWVQS